MSHLFSPSVGWGRRQDSAKKIFEMAFFLIKVPKGVKITSATYCQLSESVLDLEVAEVLILKRFKLNFQDDNAPSHSANKLQVFFVILWVIR